MSDALLNISMLVLLNMSKRNVVIVLGVWLWHCFKTTVYVCVVLNIATFWGDTIVPRDQLNMTKLLSLEKDVVMAKKMRDGRTNDISVLLCWFAKHLF